MKAPGIAVYATLAQPFTTQDTTNYLALQERHHRVALLLLGADESFSIHAPFSSDERISMIDEVLIRLSVRDLRIFTSQLLPDELPQHNDAVITDLMAAKNFYPGIRSDITIYQASDMEGYDVLQDGPSVLEGILGQTDGWAFHCQKKVIDYIDEWTAFSARGKTAMRDYAAIKALKKQYGDGPFQAVDVVVVKGQKVLTIRRGKAPCLGHIAFPGGFIDPGETPLEAAQRELGEETNLGAVLMGLPAGTPVPFIPSTSVLMDRPNRDPRYTHCSTTAFLWILPDDGEYPPVSGADDAMPDGVGNDQATAWRDIDGLHPDSMWADSIHILRHLLKISLPAVLHAR